MTWQKDAACRTKDVRLFFPTNQAGINRAKRICETCTVRTRCLDFALSHPMTEDRGVFGGTTHHERNAIRESLIRLRFPA